MENSIKISILKDIIEGAKTSEFFSGMCVIIDFTSRKYRGNEINWWGVFDTFPELLKYKPENAEKFWFPLDEEHRWVRIEILKKVLKEIEYQEEKPWYIKMWKIFLFKPTATIAD